MLSLNLQADIENRFINVVQKHYKGKLAKSYRLDCVWYFERLNDNV
jgi:hypothetical protein